MLGTPLCFQKRVYIETNLPGVLSGVIKNWLEFEWSYSEGIGCFQPFSVISPFFTEIDAFLCHFRGK